MKEGNEGRKAEGRHIERKDTNAYQTEGNEGRKRRNQLKEDTEGRANGRREVNEWKEGW